MDNSDIWEAATAVVDRVQHVHDRANKARIIYDAILAERKRCIGHVYGLAGSDNVAQRTVEAIESGQ